MVDLFKSESFVNFDNGSEVPYITSFLNGQTDIKPAINEMTLNIIDMIKDLKQKFVKPENESSCTEIPYWNPHEFSTENRKLK